MNAKNPALNNNFNKKDRIVLVPVKPQVAQSDTNNSLNNFLLAQNTKLWLEDESLIQNMLTGIKDGTSISIADSGDGGEANNLEKEEDDDFKMPESEGEDEGEAFDPSVLDLLENKNEKLPTKESRFLALGEDGESSPSSEDEAVKEKYR